MADLPSYVWALVLLGVLGVPIATVVVLYRGALSAGLRPRVAYGVGAVAAIVFAGWLVSSWVMAATGVYSAHAETGNPWLAVAFAASFVVLLLLTRIPPVTQIVRQPGTAARLAWPHAVRVLGAVFLVVWAVGGLPAVFVVPAAVGDIAIGLAAPAVARRLAGGTGRRGGVWFNALGLVDFAVAITIGLIAGPGPLRLLDVTPTTANLTLLPLALIPTVLVPITAALHVVSLRRLAVTPARVSSVAAVSA